MTGQRERIAAVFFAAVMLVSVVGLGAAAVLPAAAEGNPEVVAQQGEDLVIDLNEEPFDGLEVEDEDTVQVQGLDQLDDGFSAITGIDVVDDELVLRTGDETEDAEPATVTLLLSGDDTAIDLDVDATIEPSLSDFDIEDDVTIDQGDDLEVNITGAKETTGSPVNGDVDVEFDVSDVDGLDDETVTETFTFDEGEASATIVDGDDTGDIAAADYDGIEATAVGPVEASDEFDLTVEPVLDDFEVDAPEELDQGEALDVSIKNAEDKAGDAFTEGGVEVTFTANGEERDRTFDFDEDGETDTQELVSDEETADISADEYTITATAEEAENNFDVELLAVLESFDVALDNDAVELGQGTDFEITLENALDVAGDDFNGTVELDVEVQETEEFPGIDAQNVEFDDGVAEDIELLDGEDTDVDADTYDFEATVSEADNAVEGEEISEEFKVEVSQALVAFDEATFETLDSPGESDIAQGTGIQVDISGAVDAQEDNFDGEETITVTIPGADGGDDFTVELTNVDFDGGTAEDVEVVSAEDSKDLAAGEYEVKFSAPDLEDDPTTSELELAPVLDEFDAELDGDSIAQGEQFDIEITDAKDLAGDTFDSDFSEDSDQTVDFSFSAEGEERVFKEVSIADGSAVVNDVVSADETADIEADTYEITADATDHSFGADGAVEPEADQVDFDVDLEQTLADFTAENPDAIDQGEALDLELTGAEDTVGTTFDGEAEVDIDPIDGVDPGTVTFDFSEGTVGEATAEILTAGETEVISADDYTGIDATAGGPGDIEASDDFEVNVNQVIDEASLAVKEDDVTIDQGDALQITLEADDLAGDGFKGTNDEIVVTIDELDGVSEAFTDTVDFDGGVSTETILAADETEISAVEDEAIGVELPGDHERDSFDLTIEQVLDTVDVSEAVTIDQGADLTVDLEGAEDKAGEDFEGQADVTFDVDALTGGDSVTVEDVNFDNGESDDVTVLAGTDTEIAAQTESINIDPGTNSFEVTVKAVLDDFDVDAPEDLFQSEALDVSIKNAEDKAGEAFTEENVDVTFTANGEERDRTFDFDEDGETDTQELVSDEETADISADDYTIEATAEEAEDTFDVELLAVLDDFTAEDVTIDQGDALDLDLSDAVDLAGDDFDGEVDVTVGLDDSDVSESDETVTADFDDGSATVKVIEAGEDTEIEATDYENIDVTADDADNVDDASDDFDLTVEAVLDDFDVDAPEELFQGEALDVSIENAIDKADDAFTEDGVDVTFSAEGEEERTLTFNFDADGKTDAQELVSGEETADIPADDYKIEATAQDATDTFNVELLVVIDSIDAVETDFEFTAIVTGGDLEVTVSGVEDRSGSPADGAEIDIVFELDDEELLSEDEVTVDSDGTVTVDIDTTEIDSDTALDDVTVTAKATNAEGGTVEADTDATIELVHQTEDVDGNIDTFSTPLAIDDGDIRTSFDVNDNDDVEDASLVRWDAEEQEYDTGVLDLEGAEQVNQGYFIQLTGDNVEQERIGFAYAENELDDIQEFTLNEGIHLLGTAPNDVSEVTSYTANVSDDAQVSVSFAAIPGDRAIDPDEKEILGPTDAYWVTVDETGERTVFSPSLDDGSEFDVDSIDTSAASTAAP